MTAPIGKTVIVAAGPTGPTGLWKGVNILGAFTGVTGELSIWNQATGPTGPNGTFETIYNIGPTGLTGGHKNVIILGYSGGGGGGLFAPTSYSAFPGSGYRRQLITVTTTADITNGPLSNLVDGAKSADNNHGLFLNTAQTGREFKFAFPSAIWIDEFTWTQSSAGTQGTFDLRGSNDDVTYTVLQAGINLGGASAVDVHTVGTPGFYKYYKLISTAGSTNTTPWIEEIEFKVGFPASEGSGSAAGPTAYTNIYGQGARSTTVMAHMNQATACAGADVGAMQGLVDGDTSTQSCAASTAFVNGATGVVITFTFPTPIVINEFTWLQQSIANQGTYTLDGSVDGITFTTLATGIVLGLATTDVHAFTNSAGYHIYRLTQTAGALNSTPWIFEVNFKTSALA